MKTLNLTFIFFLCILVNYSNLALSQSKKAGETKDSTITFKGSILPLLQANCNPCHFPGGKVYAKLPFDTSITIIKLGKKLFTRIHDKEQQEIITKWLFSEGKTIPTTKK